jgi:hypothetical protein
MILSKVFPSEGLMNAFVESEGVKVISIFDVIVSVDTGLPLPGCGTYYTKQQHIKIYYETNDNMNGTQTG